MNFPRGLQTRAAGVAIALVVIAVLMLTLFLILAPVGSVDCSRVTFEQVRQAVASVGGYSYRLTGTELISTPHFSGSNSEMTFTYEESRIEAVGAYQAPDRWRFEAMTGLQGGPPGSSNFSLLNQEIVIIDTAVQVDAFIVVADAAWVRVQGANGFIPALGVEVGDYVQRVDANRLGPLLDGQIVEVTPRPLPFVWTVRAEGNRCVMAGELTGFASRTHGGKWQLAVDVDPTNSLPARMRQVVNYALPDTTQAFAWDLTFAIDYETAPQIEPPEVPPL